MNVLDSALNSRLQGGTALTVLLSGTTAIYKEQAPDNTTLPYVVFSFQGGGDMNITPSRMKDMLIYVRGYASSMALAGSIDTQIDTLLHNSVLTVSGWSNIWAARETDVERVEETPGGDVYTSGAVYRFILDS
jgi:hypothetical protein